MKFWGLLIGFAVLLRPCSGVLAGSSEQPSAPQVGATVPWITCEAEHADTTGNVVGPDYTPHTPANEASGRGYVKLTTNGQYVSFTAKTSANGLVVRYSLPAPAQGQKTDATLSLYINKSFKAKLSMTSRFCYLYGNYPFSNQPAMGSPRRFWDELRVMPGDIHPGDIVRLQKDAGDVAQEYRIDFVDFESIQPPLVQPAGSVSIEDFGARSPDGVDCRPAIIRASEAARAQHKMIWIPPGRFTVKGSLDVNDIEIRGAGMWYSTLVGTNDYSEQNRVAINGAGSNIHLSDFAIVGNLTYRSDREANDGLVGSYDENSTIRNIWVEHTKTGAWLTNSQGLLVEGCRFRDTIADGINLCLGMRNTTVRNCTARGGGDDCFAVWPAVYAESRYHAGGNRFTHCTAQLPFLAQGFSIYGGDSNTVDDCLAIDIPYGAGLFASTTFPTEFGFSGTTTFEHIHLTRAGESNGAVATVANLRDLSGLRFTNIKVMESPTDGIKFISMNGHALSDTNFDHIYIERPGVSGKGYGIVVTPDAVGSANLHDVTVVGPRTAMESTRFKLVENTANSSSGDRDVDRHAAVGP